MSEFPKAAVATVIDKHGKKRSMNLRYKMPHVLAGQMVVFNNRFEEQDFDSSVAEVIGLEPEQHSHPAHDYNVGWQNWTVRNRQLVGE
jgi:hypothetical protein